MSGPVTMDAACTNTLASVRVVVNAGTTNRPALPARSKMTPCCCN
jgi:hypothetical protein